MHLEKSPFFIRSRQQDMYAARDWKAPGNIE